MSLSQEKKFHQPDDIDPEIVAIKARILQYQEDAARMKEMQTDIDVDMKEAQLPLPSAFEAKQEVDGRSVYVGNVDYNTTAVELVEYFEPCGTVNRVTIPCNLYDNSPKGFAYVEFATPEAAQEATKLNMTLFRNRLIKVLAKRTNIPGMSTERPTIARSRRGVGPFRGGGGGAPVRFQYY